MRKILMSTILAAAAFFAGCPADAAQGTDPASGPFDVKEITFDSWCQNTQHYAPDRCQARRAEDVKAFEDYRGTVEHYEFDYLKQQRKDQEIQNLTNSDPTANVAGKLDSTP